MMMMVKINYDDDVDDIMMMIVIMVIMIGVINKVSRSVLLFDIDMRVINLL